MPKPPSVPKPDLHGSINHVSITVSDLPEAMKFFGPMLKFLGYTVGEIFDDNRTGGRLTFNINESNGTAFNVWQAKLDHPFEVYEPGVHHVAFNVQRHEQVDELFALVRSLGAEILDGPGEFPFGPGGYYAFYFLGPDRLKFEVVHMRASGAELPTNDRCARTRVALKVVVVSPVSRKMTPIYCVIKRKRFT